MAEAWPRLLTRWTDARVLDEDTAARIRAFELTHADSSRFRWPIWLALVFGALTLAAGVLLFVSAHWDTVSPQARFALVIALVAVFHVGGALASERFPAMADTLHVIGTIALGAGVFLAGQIFHLDEHWPGGLMLWALGAAIAWALLRAWPHSALVALLAPAWLTAEWLVAIGEIYFPSGYRVAAGGTFLLALAYFSALRPGSGPASRPEHIDLRRRTLVWLGGIALVPAALTLAFDTIPNEGQPLAAGLRIVGWSVALGLPLILAIVLRRAAAWPNVLAMCWVLTLFALYPAGGEAYRWYVYAWWALGATALAAWGVSDARSERINMGAAIFAATVFTFYFAQVMDQLGRSASLVGLGMLFLAGGWAIDRARRRLIVKAQGGLS